MKDLSIFIFVGIVLVLAVFSISTTFETTNRAGQAYSGIIGVPQVTICNLDRADFSITGNIFAIDENIGEQNFKVDIRGVLPISRKS